MLLVVMGIVISLVLSIASRSLYDATATRQERENSSTFAIAESGVEEALRQLSDNPATATGGTLSDTQNLVDGQYSINTSNSYDMYVKEGETAQIDLAGTNGSVTISWGKSSERPTTCVERSGMAPPAIEATLIGPSPSFTVSRTYFNARTTTDGCTISGNGFLNSATDGPDDLDSSVFVNTVGKAIMRVKPLYSAATIRVEGTGLTSQLYLIQSKAEEGDARSDIEAKRTKNAAGSIFDYAVFSGTTIIK